MARKDASVAELTKIFEDSAAGVLSAKRAGMMCVALARPGAPKQDTSPADLVLPTLADYSPERLGQAVMRKRGNAGALGE